MSQTNGGEVEPAPRFLSVGRILGRWGVKGEARVHLLTDFPERLQRRGHIYVDEELREIESCFPHKGGLVIKLAGVDTPEQADALRGKLLEIPVAEASPLPPGHFYQYQIIGLQVWTEQGRYLGPVREILSTPAQDVYVIDYQGSEVLIPAVKDIIRQIDLPLRRITIRALPGLLPEESPDP
ncbi:MAG: 16S rRNA processing protein RimM [Chloroflexota bacterium]|nr:MAG: 16S rRNA processing protein RimM [Chloroflexota bacterium]